MLNNKMSKIKTVIRSYPREVLTAVLLMTCFFLSFASEKEICSASCAAAHKYTIFGTSFGKFGIGFFTLAQVIFILKHEFQKEYLRVILQGMIVAAAGAEMAFLAYQYLIIQDMCPLCIAIAIAVFLLFVIQAWELRLRDEKPMAKLKTLGNWFLIIFIAGFLALGGTKMASSEVTTTTPSPFLGSDKKVEVYIVTDWFCPACKAKSSVFAEVYKTIQKDAQVLFVDMGIHKRTFNFSPYNLSFQIYEKGKYLELRAAMERLAATTDKPTPEMVQKAINHLNVKYQELDEIDQVKGINFFIQLADQFKIDRTPTVVVRSAVTGKVIKLAGTDKISIETVKKAIVEVQQP